MDCDICGKISVNRKALVEGAILNVCDKCVELGAEIGKKERVIEESRDDEIFGIIIPDCSYRVKVRREVMNLSQKELAFKINEKESVIHLIESGKLIPTFDSARKLERFLGITLIVKEEKNPDKKIDFKDRTLTIGDMVKLKENGQY